MKKLKLILLTLIISSFFGIVSQAQAASPVLNFSDMTDAPVIGWEGSSTKGAAVSIYGRNFGTERGNSYVTIGGVDLVNASDYAEWGATTNPIVPLGMQRITFYLNSSMSLGDTTITVTTSEGTSESIPFYTRTLGSNHIYFVSNSGTDDNGSVWVGTWLRENLQAGDIVYIKTGIYNQEDDGSTTHPWAQRGNIDLCYGSPKNFNDGLEHKSITVTAYPGELVKFEALDKDNEHPRSFLRVIYTHIARWTFSKLQINADQPFDFSDNVEPPYDGQQSHLRFINLDITTPWVDNTNMDYYSYGDAMDFNFGDNSDHLYVFGCYMHDIAADFRGQAMQDPVDGFRSYFMYANGYGTVNNFEVAWNEFGWNSSSRGLQFYGHHEDDKLNNLYLHDNWVHDTTRQGVIFSGEGGDHDYSFINTVYIYNNIISNTGETDECLQMGGSYGNGKYGGNYHVYNNVFDCGENNDYPAILVGKDIDSLEFKNNIVIGVANTHDYFDYFPDNYSDFVANVTPDANNNLYYGAGANKKPNWDNSTLDNIDPLFSSATPSDYLDFQLQSTSPARNTGTTVATVAKDFLGILRPQGTAYDIGAYEFVESSGTEIRADVDQNSTINSTDAMLTLRNSLSLDMSSTNWVIGTHTGDVNCDDSSNSTDAMLILRKSLELDMTGTGWCID